MSQKVPMDRFKWEDSSSWSCKEILEFDTESNIGLIFEVDIEIPEDIHDSTSDYPLCPNPLIIKESMISSKSA